MTTDRTPKEAKDQKNRRQETVASEEAFQTETPVSSPQNHANILKLQRTIGNQAVQRLLAESNSLVQREESAPVADAPVEPARPVITPDVLAAMDAQIDWIIGKLKEWRFDADEQMQVLGIIRQYSHMDFETYESTGYSGSDYLDKFLVKLKMRSFHDDTYSTFGIEKTQLVYDALWTQFDDEQKAILASYVADSKKEKTNGPLVEQQPGFWQTMGKQEAMGLWGMLKGMGTGLGGVIDAGAGGISSALKAVGVPIEDPIKVSQYLEKQFDESGEIMFGKEFKEGDKLLGSFNAGDIGKAGGTLIWQLTMMGAGNAAGTAAWAQNAKTGMDIAGNLGGIVEAANKIGDVIARHQEKGTLDVESLLGDADLLNACAALAMNIGQALMQAKGVGTKTKEAEEAFQLLKNSFGRLSNLLSIAQITQTLDKLDKILSAPNLSPQATEKEITETIFELIKQGTSVVAENYGTTEIGGGAGEPQKPNIDPGKSPTDEGSSSGSSSKSEEVGAPKQQSEESPFGAPNSFIGEPEAHPTSSQSSDSESTPPAKQDLFDYSKPNLGEEDPHATSPQSTDSNQTAKEDLFDYDPKDIGAEPEPAGMTKDTHATSKLDDPALIDALEKIPSGDQRPVLGHNTTIEEHLGETVYASVPGAIVAGRDGVPHNLDSVDVILPDRIIQQTASASQGDTIVNTFKKKLDSLLSAVDPTTGKITSNKVITKLKNAEVPNLNQVVAGNGNRVVELDFTFMREITPRERAQIQIIMAANPNVQFTLRQISFTVPPIK